MFNWFRRQFGTPSKAEEEQKQTSEPSQHSAGDSSSSVEQAQTTEPEPEPEEIATEAKQENYLNCAKAAYQNIQERKGSAQPEESNHNTEAPLLELVAEIEITAVEAIPAESEAEIAIPIRQTETVTETVIPTAESTAVATEEEAAESAQGAMPAWMRKSDRLEILKETAIETPTPEAEKLTPTPAEESQQANLTFDEEFIWSAKVLASQGRRPEEISEEEISWLKRLRQGLGKTRRS
ncbi:MAG: hypothetical protein ACRDEA_12130, partial [Microcystaceae cyanobacterium]